MSFPDEKIVQGVERKVLELKKEIFSIHKNLKVCVNQHRRVSRVALTVHSRKAAYKSEKDYASQLLPK